MALTPAERAKRYREKLKEDPDKLEKQRKKQLERLKKNRKRINDLTEGEKTRRREQWREEKKKQALKKKKKESEDQTAVPRASTSQSNATPALKIRYTKICRSYRRALENIRKLKLKNEATRKKLYRETLAHKKIVRELQDKNNKLMARQELLELSLRKTYKTTKTVTEKRLLKSVALNQLVKTNRSVSVVASCLGLKGRIRQFKKRTGLIRKKIQEQIKDFYTRDDISRITAGIRETKTRGKKKMQKRYLTDTLQNLYEIYKKEGGTQSFTTFFRYKPYYVLSPTAKNRDTCMCVKHCNIEYLYIALKNKHVVDYKNLEDLITKSVCDKNSYACMYDQCCTCKPKLKYKEEKFYEDITWFKWERVSHTYEKSGKNFNTKKTVKQLKKGTVRDLVMLFEEEFPKFKRHYYNWKEQQRQYQMCIKNLAMKEIAILIDFSENYDSKLGTEIQAMHFGASKCSISLHCGIIYWNDKSQSFVTISNNACHEPNAIWAHLLPILQLVKKVDPTIEIIHFFSDGPTSQYRQKKNFFLINLFTKKLKLTYITWSFSESGHGKGVADGIGGAVKRQLDRHVAYGYDVKDANDAYQHLSTSMKSVKCFTISDGDIENINKIIPKNLKAVPETMKLHQIISVDVGKIMYRQLSCFCGDRRGLCSCLNPKMHSFDSDQTVSATDTVTCDKTDQGDDGAQTISDIDQNAAFTDINVQNNSGGQTVSVFNLEDVPNDGNSGGQNRTANDQSERGGHTLNVDLIVSPSQEANQTYSVMELNVDEIVDLNIFDNVIDYPQTGFDLVSDSVDGLREDCLIENINKDKENVNKRKNSLMTLHKGPLKKKTKVLPIKEENFRSRSLTTIINRNFTCHLCRLRKLYVIRDMTKCIACENWVCRSCCDQPAIDYICDRCFGE